MDLLTNLRQQKLRKCFLEKRRLFAARTAYESFVHFPYSYANRHTHQRPPWSRLTVITTIEHILNSRKCHSCHYDRQSVW